MRGQLGTVDLESREILQAPRGRYGKLDAETVSEIRMRYAKGNASCSELAKYYNTSAQNILYIVSRHTWKHVP